VDRRIAIASAGGSWSPRSLSPLAWYYAHADYVTVTGTSTVSAWRDRSGNNNTLTQSVVVNQPNWETTAWGSGKPSLQFTGNNSLTLTSGSLLAAGSGTDRALGVFVTLQVTLAGDNAVACWDNTVGSAEILCRMDNPGLNAMRFSRQDNAGTSVSITGSEFDNSHARIGYRIGGTAIAFCINSLANAESGCDVGATTVDRFRLGDGPGATDSLQARIVEAVFFGRQPSIAEWLAYYVYSVAEWG
jgi:hypothetical protein